MGRLSFQKDPWTLHEAFAWVAATHPDWHFIHVGKGPIGAEVRRHAQALGIHDRIVWRDYLADPTQFYAAVDLVVQTSIYEGLSLVCLETLASGLPMVLTDAPGNRDLKGFAWSHVWFCERSNRNSVVRAIAAWDADRSAARPSNHATLIQRNFSAGLCYRAIMEEYHIVKGKNGASPA
jgi:glycosyltransferase involved in cell wall biosynthesis